MGKEEIFILGAYYVGLILGVGWGLYFAWLFKPLCPCCMHPKCGLHGPKVSDVKKLTEKDEK